MDRTSRPDCTCLPVNAALCSRWAWELDFTPLFGELNRYGMTSVVELIPYSLLAIAVVSAAIVYVNFFHSSELLFRRLTISNHFKPMLGAIAAWAVVSSAYLGFGRDERMLAGLGSGYGILQQAMASVASLPIYSSQVDSPLDSPAHNGDFAVDLLEGILVGEVFKPRKLRTFRNDATLDEIVHSLTKSSQRYFLVYNASDQLVGIFSVDDVRLSLYDELLWKVANASDIMVGRVVTLRVDDDLNTALNRFTALNIDELPVVENDNSNRILGVLRRKETIAAFNRRPLEWARKREMENS